jgi:hypothetical protein
MKNTVALLGGRAELDRDTVPMLNKTEGDEMDGDTTVALLGGRAGLDRDTVAMLDKTNVDEMDGDTVALLGGRAGLDRDTVVMLDKTEVHEPVGAAGRQKRCTPRSERTVLMGRRQVDDGVGEGRTARRERSGLLGGREPCCWTGRG